MRKPFLLTLPLFVIIVLAVTLLLLNRRIPAWHESLDQYLVYSMMQAGEPLYTVEASSAARQPAYFLPGMSSASFSDGAIFATTLSSSSGQDLGGEPIPFPPDQVECVLLKSGVQHKLVYIALHSNMYNADWIVHLSPYNWGSPEQKSALNSLGCKLGQ